MSAIRADHLPMPPDGAQPVRPQTSALRQTTKLHIADEVMTLSNWHKQVNWLNFTLVIVVPMWGLVQSFWVPLCSKTAIWAIVYYFMCGLGITAGRELAHLPGLLAVY